jgi:hypothetical protein
VEAKLAEEKPAFAFKVEAGATVTEPAPVCKTEGDPYTVLLTAPRIG